MDKIIAFLWIVLPIISFAQDKPAYSILHIPVELLENADAVIRNQQIHFEVEAPGKATYKEQRVVTIMNEDSGLEHLVIFYDTYNKLGKISGKIYDASGNLVREVNKKEVRDESHISDFSIYEDNRVRYIEINHQDYPFTVEFEYEMVYKHLLHYPEWDIDRFNVALEAAEFKITLLSDVDLLYQALNVDVEPAISQKGSSKSYTWVINNIKAVPEEPYCPPSSELLPSILVAPSIFEAENYTGSMSSWVEFGAFVNKLMDGRDVLSSEMKKTVQELIANATSDIEKIAILYRYMQENMRYVSVQLGIGGYQPFDAQYVESNKYGDCKALSNFMKAMLKEAGISSNPVLVYSGDIVYEVTNDFTFPAFNHMILYVPVEDTWLECTSSITPPNYLSNSTADRNVLLITETGGALARTPVLSPVDNAELNVVDISVDEKGMAIVNVISSLKGSKQDRYRYAKKYFSAEEVKEKMQESISLPSFTLDRLVIEPVADKPETTISFETSVPRYASKAGKRLFIPLNTLNAHRHIPPQNDTRQHPIYSNYGHIEKDSITLHLPVGYHIESMPSESNIIQSDYGNYSLEIEQNQYTITIKRQLEILPVRLPASDYDKWRDFHKQVAKLDGSMLVLVGKS